jgi:hypothetical protein
MNTESGFFDSAIHEPGTTGLKFLKKSLTGMIPLLYLTI